MFNIDLWGSGVGDSYWYMGLNIWSIYCSTTSTSTSTSTATTGTSLHVCRYIYICVYKNWYAYCIIICMTRELHDVHTCKYSTDVRTNTVLCWASEPGPIIAKKDSRHSQEPPGFSHLLSFSKEQHIDGRTPSMEKSFLPFVKKCLHCLKDKVNHAPAFTGHCLFLSPLIWHCRIAMGLENKLACKLAKLW